MADEVDIANDYCDYQMEALLAQRTVYMGESSEYCEECGDKIPLARQSAIPGCSLCVHCAQDLERALVF